MGVFYTFTLNCENLYIRFSALVVMSTKPFILLFSFFGLIFALALFAFFTANPTFTGLAIFSVNDQSSFDQGSYFNVSFNGTALVLVGDNLTGSYLSPFFNGTNLSSWTHFSWDSVGISPIVFVRSCSSATCADSYWSQLLLESPSSLSVPNSTYFQYKVFFSRQTPSDIMGLTNVSITYDSVPVSLAVRVIEPRPGAFYSATGLFSLNLTLNGTAQACWYTLNGGSSVDIPGCQNTTLTLSSEGNYLIRVFANTSEGVVVNRSSNFSIGQNYPSLYSINPPSGYVTNNSNQSFTYYVEDSDIDHCNLLTDFAGNWATSAVNNTQVVSGSLNSFDSSAISNGTFLWGVECFDAQAHVAKTGSRFIAVDTVLPQITLNAPAGVVSSRHNIPLSLSFADASPTTCIYSISKLGQGTLLVIVMPQCVGTSFNVANDGDYQASVMATDAAGNTVSTTSSFSVVSTGSSGGSSSSGGGGVSVDVSSLVVPRLSYTAPGSFSLKAGFSEFGSIDVSNSGNVFLNNCSIGSSVSSWVVSNDLFSLSPGQHFLISFNLSVPRGTVPGSYASSLNVTCSELSENVPLLVEVLPADFEFSFISAERVGTALNVSYTLHDLTGHNQELTLEYALHTESGQLTLEGSNSVSLGASALEHKQLLFELPKDSFGSFNLTLRLSSPSDSLTSENPIFIPFSTVSGLAISGDNRKTLTITGLVILIGACLFFVLRFAYNRWKRIDALQQL
jgi:hypothetical protein